MRKTVIFSYITINPALGNFYIKFTLQTLDNKLHDHISKHHYLLSNIRMHPSDTMRFHHKLHNCIQKLSEWRVVRSREP